MSGPTIENALARSMQQWTFQTTHTEAEQAFMDRTALAVEVRRLRDETVAMEQELREAEREIADLTRETELLRDTL